LEFGAEDPTVVRGLGDQVAGIARVQRHQFVRSGRVEPAGVLNADQVLDLGEGAGALTIEEQLDHVGTPDPTEEPGIVEPGSPCAGARRGADTE
jgi:hypothetical protein